MLILGVIKIIQQQEKRISKHLTNISGGTIAVVTAVLVVNPPFQPEWVWWYLNRSNNSSTF